MRVTQEDWTVLVDYAEENPEIITNQLVGPRGRENLNLKWDTLATVLNSVEQGSKTVIEWKKSFSDWKSNTKKKHSIIRQSQTGTGGGPGCALSLADIELRLLHIMGQTAIDGDEGIEEYGLPKRDEPRPHPGKQIAANAYPGNCRNLNRSTENRRKRYSEDTEDCFIDDDTENIAVEVDYVPNKTSSRKKKIELSSEIERMNDNTLKVLNSIDNSIKSMAKDVNKFVSVFVESEGNKI